MNVGHVIWLRVANIGLPETERRYYNLKSEVNSLEEIKQNLSRIIQEYDGQAKALGKTLDSYFVRCEQKEKRLTDLRTMTKKEEYIARCCQNNNAEIRKTAEEKVRVTLYDRKKLLELISRSMIELIRENPERYGSLIQHDVSATTDYTSSYYHPYNMYMYNPSQQRRQPKAYFTEDYVTMLSEDADKLLEKLVKELGDEVINDYAAGKSPSPSLPAFSIRESY